MDIPFIALTLNFDSFPAGRVDISILTEVRFVGVPIGSQISGAQEYSNWYKTSLLDEVCAEVQDKLNAVVLDPVSSEIGCIRTVGTESVDETVSKVVQTPRELLFSKDIESIAPLSGIGKI